MSFKNTLEYAQKCDAEDPLKHFRENFFIPQYNNKESIYFTGNSLGLQPKATKDYFQKHFDIWAELAVEGHFQGDYPWMYYHESFADQLSGIVGGLPQEIVVMNQLTVNLHLLMVTFYRPDKKRYKIICEAKAFPSDQYAFESQVKHHQLNPDEAIIEVKPREGEHTLRTEDIIEVIEKHAAETALVLFGGINYYSGQLLDMETITRAAHKAGAYAGFDLAHAAGNVALKLHDWNVDFACWCSYKYLNSGPGSVSGIFIHEKHAVNTDLPRFAGWWGYKKEKRFKMGKTFEAIPSAEGWLISNTPVFSMVAHKASLDIFEEAGFENILKKSKLLTGFLYFILHEINAGQSEKSVEIITPQNEDERGSQVSMLMLKNGKQTFDALIEKGVMADWREPNVIRVAPVPLYNSFEDVWQFGNIIKAKVYATE